MKTVLLSSIFVEINKKLFFGSYGGESTRPFGDRKVHVAVRPGRVCAVPRGKPSSDDRQGGEVGRMFS